MGVICCDISKWQAGFNFSAFKGQGGLGVIMKATESTSIKDGSYPTFRPQALAQGLKVATYHFFRTTDPTAQANFYLGYANPDQGERVVCDWEDNNTTVAQVISFLKAVQSARPDLQLTVYSGNTAKEKLSSSASDANNTWLAANTSLWLAQYTTGTPSWPKQVWPQWSLWQYTDQIPKTGAIPGANGAALDLNRFNGSDDNFLKWMGPAGAAPPAPTPPAPGTVANITITLESDTPVNITVKTNSNVTFAGNQGMDD